jgi:hypothetical protein
MADLPADILIKDRGSIYNAITDTWLAGFQAIFRPSAISLPINLAGIASHVVIIGKQGLSIKIVSLFFTVSGATNVTFWAGAVPLTGPMDFGDSGEPKGIVIPFPFSPLELDAGAGFIIQSSTAVRISGAVCFFYQ